MLTLSFSIDLNDFPQFLCFIIQFIRCQPHFFFIKNLPKIIIPFQIKKPVDKNQLTHISIKEWNFLIVRSVSLNILIIVVVRWFPSKKSSNLLLNFAYNLLTLFMKLVELNPSVNCIFNFVVVVVVVTVAPTSHQTRVCQGSNTNVVEALRKHTRYSLWWT